MLKKLFFLTIILFAFSIEVFAQNIKIAEYYQLNGGNSWNYTAPPSWKGDYISRMEEDGKNFIDLVATETQPAKSANIVLHYDATNAAKVLAFIEGEGLYYLGENFADKTKVRFDTLLLWFPEKIKIGQKINLESGLTRTLADGKTVRGTYKLTQQIVGFEDMTVTAGSFKKALRIESETFWDLGDGRKARSVNVYHYAKNVGVIKASARFIIINEAGKEVINRLVETDLKSYQLKN